MDNFEEEYYDAKRKYEDAQDDLIEYKNIGNKIDEEKRKLNAINEKITYIDKCIKECEEILDCELMGSKKSISALSMQYLETFSSDLGVANIEEAFSEGKRQTEGELNILRENLQNIKEKVIEEKEGIEKRIRDYNRKLEGLGSKKSIMKRIEEYGVLKEYYRRKMNE